MAMSAGGKKGGTIADINVTPMADIMIVLLIIFMVMTPIIVQEEVKLPPAAHAREHEKEAERLVVLLKKDSTAFVDGQSVATDADLSQRVRERLEGLPEGKKVVYLKADESLAYSEVSRVMDLCRQAGVEQVAFMADKKVEG